MLDRFIDWLNSPVGNSRYVTAEEIAKDRAANPDFYNTVDGVGAVIGLFTPGASVLNIFKIKGAVQATEYTVLHIGDLTGINLNYARPPSLQPLPMSNTYQFFLINRPAR